jgi:membrane protein
MGRVLAVAKRTCVAFYDDQMTHHAAALTYYSLMSLFPTALLAVSLLGLIGQYPETYDSLMSYLRDVVPADVLVPFDDALKTAFESKGTAFTSALIGVALALYGTTGALEAARRALNVVFEVDGGRSFARRKSVDIASTFVLLILVLVTLILVFVGGRFAEDLLGFVGLGSTAADVWSAARWPAAFAVAVLIYALVYYVTPDVKHRAFHWVTPGAVAGVFLWLGASALLSFYIGEIANVGAIYGSFGAAIVLVGWLWLTNAALLFGAELDAELEREKEMAEGVPRAATLNRPARQG